VGGQRAERDAAVAEVAAHGWFIARASKKGYYVMRCGCGRHQATMHKTPRLQDHFKQRAGWMISLCSTQRKDGD
jgi:hypothetical protein